MGSDKNVVSELMKTPTVSMARSLKTLDEQEYCISVFHQNVYSLRRYSVDLNEGSCVMMIQLQSDTNLIKIHDIPFEAIFSEVINHGTKFIIITHKKPCSPQKELRVLKLQGTL